MKRTSTLSSKLVRIGTGLLFVALISISLTLWVTWQLSGGAAALNEAGRMRMQTWRLTSEVQAQLAPSDIAALTQEFDVSMRLLKNGDPSRPLFVPWDEEVQRRYAEVERLWQSQKVLYTIRPIMNHDKLVAEATIFLKAIDDFVWSIEGQMAGLTAILNLFQMVMMALAIGAAVIMLYTGYMYVINPLSYLRDGLRKIESAQFSVRVEVVSNDEFGQVASGFNRMAATLQSLYGNLEAQVTAKTERIAAQKERLEALYGVSTFLAQTTDMQEMTQGFTQRVRQLMKADAIALRWSGEDPSKLLLLASDQFPQVMQEQEKCLMAGSCACGQVRADSRTRVIPITSSDAAPLQHCTRLGYESMIAVPVRMHNKKLGEINLFYKSLVSMSAEELELLDTLASHLAAAVEGMRAVVLGREAAIAGERSLLARELHDSIAQSLAFLKIQVQLLRSAIFKNDNTKTNLALSELDSGLKESIADVRELLLHFRTRTQADDIDNAVQETLQKFQHQTGLQVSSKTFGEGLPLPQDMQTHVLHVLQESLSNVRKHACARSVEIEIHKGEPWRFLVRDDGVGFDLLGSRTELQVGLKIMRERADQIGATVAIDSVVGQGTTVSLRVPTDMLVKMKVSPTAPLS
ncbi:type IV pili methyl-accepting chemotaxis transducer N-terminal domain-containing protein [Limnohabitans sp. Rim8]|uniref:type IV pili methyl-accepting chemotaxis transducer N-terminal domain-containing protein n=1 Tax=Limnohabitans sp. Rim8 TaxID=1100718 RepID=UPI002639879A|nr:type IV pili methyl-accepting chemotaxis transducer N-terminal domain-containing protein [Limnohabitans sp. Rim8]